MSLQVSVPSGLVGLGGSAPVTASVLGWHYNHGTGSRKKHGPLGRISLSPHLSEPCASAALVVGGENELCWYLLSFTHPVIWVGCVAGCLARRWMVPAPGKARAPRPAPVTPKLLPEVSQGSGLHSWLCCSSQGPPSLGKSRLGFAHPRGAGKVLPEEPLLTAFGRSPSERELWGLLQLPGQSQVNSERAPPTCFS